MASGILVNIKEELTCPICLELLTEPLSLDCGHTFCQACITANQKESVTSQERQSSCPVCRTSYQPGDLRRNRHVANIVETFRKIKLSQEEERKVDLCVHHGEKLLLFCKKDGKFICWLCERSQEHRGHPIFLMEEVAKEYQKELQGALDRLRSAQQKAEKFKAGIREERISWENQIADEIQSVQNCFQKMRSILDSEEQKELQKLKMEEGDILCVLEQSEGELMEQSQVLRDLISELECRLQESTMKMLQDVNSIMKRSQIFTLKEPRAISKEQRRVFQAPDLSRMMQIFNGLTDMRCYWVDITLDVSTRAQNIKISADRRQAKYEYYSYSSVSYGYGNHSGFNESSKKNNYGITGIPFFTSGKHYWEVDVSRKSAWILGVCCQKLPNLKMFFDLVTVDTGKKVNCPLTHLSKQHKNGYWVIGLKNQFQYCAFAEYSPSDHFELALSLPVRPCRVGVFLDYDARTVSFYNITSHGFLIYKFSSCAFSDEVFPYIDPMTCSQPMTLCYPSS